MAGYAYKYVRDLLPPYLTTETEGYEGDADQDGDQWYAAAKYIEELENELALQHEASGKFTNKRLLDWLKTRTKTIYNKRPAIVGGAS